MDRSPRELYATEGLKEPWFTATTIPYVETGGVDTLSQGPEELEEVRCPETAVASC